MKKGWAVEIEWANGMTSLAIPNRGLLPVVYSQRQYAKQWKDTLDPTFKCRVVRVEYMQPRKVKR